MDPRRELEDLDRQLELVGIEQLAVVVVGLGGELVVAEPQVQSDLQERRDRAVVVDVETERAHPGVGFADRRPRAVLLVAVGVGDLLQHRGEEDGGFRELLPRHQRLRVWPDAIERVARAIDAVERVEVGAQPGRAGRLLVALEQ